MPKRPSLTTTTSRAKALIGALIGLGIGGLIAAARETEAIDGMETRLIDVRTRAYLGELAPDPDIVLAVVENDDIAELREDYKWPWPIDINTLAFEWLAAAGARMVLIDVFQFDQGMGPDELGLREDDPKKKNEYVSAHVNGQFADRLAAAYRAVEKGVVLVIELSENPPEAGNVAWRLRAKEFDAITGRFPPLRANPAVVRPFVNLPVLRLLRGAKSVGFANAVPDRDGVVRRAAPIGLGYDRALPSLALAGALLSSEKHSVDADAIRIGDAVQRLGSDGRFYVAFRGPEHSYSRVRPVDLVRAGYALAEAREAGRMKELPSHGTAIPEAVRGKIVLWGINASGVKDVVAAPISAKFPGPELQVTILDNLLHGDGRVPASPAVNLATILGLCTALGAAGAGAKRRGLFLSATVLTGAALWLWSFRLFRDGTLVDLFAPSVALLLTYGSVTGFKVLTEGRQNKWLEGTFSQYLSPAVIDSLKKDPSRLELGGRRRELTVSFSDVKAFTTISESLEANDLVRLLNDYLTRQSECVLAEDGVIDKFIGDAVMSFFGDPIAHADHALRACKMAIQSLKALEGTQPLARELGVGELLNRTGIATGPVVVGNIGSDKRFNYTVMGDTVNFASRLEGANKAFGSRILLADGTYQQVKASVLAKPLAKLVVVGKSEPVPVYELVGIVSDASDGLAQHVAAFRAAHEAVLADDLDAAERHVAEAEALRPGDGPCEWLLERIRALRRGARPRPWDGVYVLESK